MISTAPCSALPKFINDLSEFPLCDKLYKSFSAFSIKFSAWLLLFEFASSRENYFSSYNNIDVILDTFPYPGGTTTCESLFMGTPVIAMEGNSFIERNSANILKNSNLNEFIVKNKTEYFELDKNFKEIFKNKYINKKKIRNKFLKSSIMDSSQFSDDFKSKIRSVWQEFCDEWF